MQRQRFPVNAVLRTAQSRLWFSLNAPASATTKENSGREGAKFRYHAGTSDEPFGASLQIADKIPARFELITRDLFLDFGEFTFTGFAFSPIDGQAALFDHIYLARQLDDFELLKVEKQ